MTAGYQTLFLAQPEDKPRSAVTSYGRGDFERWSWRDSNPLPRAPRTHWRAPAHSPTKNRPAAPCSNEVLSWPFEFINMHVLCKIALTVSRIKCNIAL